MNTIMIVALIAITYPPVPADIPFEHDPNLCASPVLSWIIVQPSLSLVYAVGVHHPGGMEINLSVVGTGGEPIDVLTDEIGSAEAPDGGLNRYYQIAWTPPAGEALHYIELIATDAIGRQDRRTVLVYVVGVDGGPTLFPVHGPLPVGRMKQAQRTVQVAKKQRFPLTTPVQVR